MIKFQSSLKELLGHDLEIPEAMNCVITGLATDSRNVKKGDAFLAYQGEHVDGRRYITQAIERGAVAIFSEASELQIKEGSVPYIEMPHFLERMGKMAAQFFQNPSEKMDVIGITGTNGKTSVSHFLANSLTQLHRSCGIIGTIGAGFPGQLFSNGFTTPYAVDLQKIFANLQAQGAQAIAMEVSSHALAQKRVCGTQFKGAIFTNLTRDHLDYHESMENYAHAKRQLFVNYPLEFAVINADDAFGQELIKTIPVSKKIAYSLSEKTTVSTDFWVIAKDVALHTEGLTAHLVTPWGEGALKSTLMGRFNVSNLLAALSTLCCLDVPFSEALKAINQQKTVPGRMEILQHPGQPTVVIDYAHTPDALEKALLALREHCRQKLWCVFGCGGDRDPGKRPLMGHLAEQYADHIILTDDNPRHEASSAILNDILKGFVTRKPDFVEPSRAKAIAYALKQASSGDMILIAGKGHEQYQQIGDEKFDFSDQQCVKEYFKHENHVS